MEVWVALVSLGLFLFVMGCYKICQTTFLRQDKSTIEETGFLSDSLLQFLEFAVLVVTFLLMEGTFLGLEEMVTGKILFIVTCFGLFICDDIALHNKLKK